MVKLLRDIQARLNPESNTYINSARVAHLSKLMQNAQGIPLMKLKLRRAEEMIRAGDAAGGIKEFERLQEELDTMGTAVTGSVRKTLKHKMAIGHLRLGEIQNCLNNHNQASCIFPIAEAGVHQLESGSRAAAALYLELLNEDPDDLLAAYLLNIAYMTLGEHPEAVPEQWLMDLNAFKGDQEIPEFKDIAPGLGIDENALAGGVVMDDMDRDGFLDLVVSSWGLSDQIKYFRNQGDGTFSDETERAGLKGISGGLNLLQADYDNDGFVDIFVLRGAWLAQGDHPNSLLKNNGDGTFEDVTKAAGVLSFHPTLTARWEDLNQDGWVDLLIGNESRGTTRKPTELYINQKNGTFKEEGKRYGLAADALVKGIASGDLNNDGYTDIYLSCLEEPNKLFMNQGPHADPPYSFKEVAQHAGVEAPMNGFPTWMFDFDNDGWQDIFVACYDVSRYGQSASDMYRELRGLPPTGEPLRLYKNNRDGTFTDVAPEVGLDKVMFSMGCNFGDMDGDGYLDIYLGTGEPDLSGIVPNRAFRNVEGRKFQDVTSASGLGHLQKGHGVAFGDIDNDGDQDIYAVIGGAYDGDNYMNVLFQNPGGGSDHITIALVGTETNRCAIGSRIKVSIAGPRGKREIHRTVCSGGSFGASPFQQNIGLGKNAKVLSVEVTWQKTGTTQKFLDLEKGGSYRITEGQGTAEMINSTVLEFSEHGEHVHHH